MATRLRQSDIDEIWATNHIKPFEALYEGWKNSVLSLTIEVSNEPVSMFGIAPTTLTGDEAIIWMLSSDKINSIKKSFIKNNRRFIDMFLSMYPRLENWVSKENKKSVAWLKLLGANMKETEMFGIDKSPFHYFTFERIA